MSSKNISLKSSVYDRLRTYKHSDESFSEAVDRMLDDTQPDWRSFVGTLSDDDAEQARELIDERRTPIRSTLRRSCSRNCSKDCTRVGRQKQLRPNNYHGSLRSRSLPKRHGRQHTSDRSYANEAT